VNPYNTIPSLPSTVPALGLQSLYRANSDLQAAPMTEDDVRRVVREEIRAEAEYQRERVDVMADLRRLTAEWDRRHGRPDVLA